MAKEKNYKFDLPADLPPSPASFLRRSKSNLALADMDSPPSSPRANEPRRVAHLSKSSSSPSFLKYANGVSAKSGPNSVEECSQAETLSCPSSVNDKTEDTKATSDTGKDGSTGASTQAAVASQRCSSDQRRLVELEKELRGMEFFQGMQQYEGKALQALMHATLGLVPSQE
eukprot:CAMPEP_0196729764 /NCGR_PEP_ID=MMETSP1091-20130531/10044_1 /TAXON_ID=302021 /ORGANISM="Rhodomonas sp., Strain CCMP768" /LENGTH=171 /DNA_ID=CAMNT_0042072683 /DNA_START=189 /DNA_END=704 /DNA_ORIENTATION=-